MKTYNIKLKFEEFLKIKGYYISVEYVGRSEYENVFKACKNYIYIRPLSNFNEELIESTSSWNKKEITRDNYLDIKKIIFDLIKDQGVLMIDAIYDPVFDRDSLERNNPYNWQCVWKLDKDLRVCKLSDLSLPVEMVLKY